jgi:hypothetical protein
MTDSWDRTLFDKELKSILETKLPVSASKISSLQQLATAHPQVSFINKPAFSVFTPALLAS